MKPQALITGGSRGIGAAICDQLAADGFHVLVHYGHNETAAAQVVERIQHAGGTAESMQCDLLQSDAIIDLFARITATKKGLKVLVNNAGVNIDALLMRMQDKDLDAMWTVNTKAAILCARAASRLLMKENGSSMIQIASVVGECGSAGQSAYAATKAALIGFSKSLARELASRQVRVNVVTPGYIMTDMTGGLTEAQKEAILRTVPLGFLGTPRDVASVVGFLASSSSRYITGQVLGVNGGMYM